MGTSKTSRARESSVCSSRICCWNSLDASVVEATGDSAVATAAVVEAVVTVTTVVVVVVVVVLKPPVV